MRVTKAPEERKAELVAAARKLFDKYGVEKTRISDIVSEVGVAQGVFYYYFASKEAMVEVVVQQVRAELEEKMQAILADEKASFACKLAGYIELYLDVIDQFMADDLSALPGLTEEGDTNLLTTQMLGVLQSSLQVLIKQGVASGDVTVEYPGETAEVLVWGLRGFALHRLPTRHMIYTMVQQALGLGQDALVQYVPNSEK